MIDIPKNWDQDALELHEDWILDARIQRDQKFGNLEQLVQSNNLPVMPAFWFFKGNLVYRPVFSELCRLLDMDWQMVVVPKFPLGEFES
ncbi:MAG TPA: hypothetical protein VK184_12380 [Nostocaceae cyanobacterium]|nr:hypothetical protein [Nostocaceae cyanobacterium]